MFEISILTNNHDQECSTPRMLVSRPQAHTRERIFRLRMLAVNASAMLKNRFPF